MGQENDRKCFQIGKEEVKLFPFTYAKILYRNYPEESTKIILELVNKLSKFEGYKLCIQKSIVLL